MRILRSILTPVMIALLSAACSTSLTVGGKTFGQEDPMSDANNQINYIELPLGNVAETKAFYTKAFGWAFTDWGPDYLSFAGAGIDGGFNGEASASDMGVGVMVVLYADDLAETLETVKEAGGKITKPIYAFPGGRRFHFLDPNGNELAVWSE